MDKWEIESKIASNFDGMLTQGQQEVLDYIEQLKQKVNQLETNRDESIELVNKIKPIYKSYIWYNNLSKILERGKE